MVEVSLLEDGRVVESNVFEDPQDALAWLWQQAEDADHDTGKLSGLIDGNPVHL